MTLKAKVANLANKEMSRRDFLKYSGVILLSAIGITGLMRVITSVGNEFTGNSTKRANTYGSSFYSR